MSVGPYTTGYGLYPGGGPPATWEYRPPWLWDVGVSEQTITNIMEGVGGRGGYGTLSPPAMGYYGADVSDVVQPFSDFKEFLFPGGQANWWRLGLIVGGLFMLGYTAGVFDTTPFARGHIWDRGYRRKWWK